MIYQWLTFLLNHVLCWLGQIMLGRSCCSHPVGRSLITEDSGVSSMMCDLIEQSLARTGRSLFECRLRSGVTRLYLFGI